MAEISSERLAALEAEHEAAKNLPPPLFEHKRRRQFRCAICGAVSAISKNDFVSFSVYDHKSDCRWIALREAVKKVEETP